MTDFDTSNPKFVAVQNIEKWHMELTELEDGLIAVPLDEIMRFVLYFVAKDQGTDDGRWTAADVGIGEIQDPITKEIKPSIIIEYNPTLSEEESEKAEELVNRRFN